MTLLQLVELLTLYKLEMTCKGYSFGFESFMVGGALYKKLKSQLMDYRNFVICFTCVYFIITITFPSKMHSTEDPNLRSSMIKLTVNITCTCITNHKCVKISTDRFFLSTLSYFRRTESQIMLLLFMLFGIFNVDQIFCREEIQKIFCIVYLIVKILQLELGQGKNCVMRSLSLG